MNTILVVDNELNTEFVPEVEEVEICTISREFKLLAKEDFHNQVRDMAPWD